MKKEAPARLTGNVESVVRDIRAGRMVIVVDDEDRENEGDLVMAADKANATTINFMATHARGLICVPITGETAARLDLKPMVPGRRDAFGTNFTAPVDAARGITTGISAADRAKAVKILADPTSKPHDLVQPGHIFPLEAKPGGVLQRAGHTEAAVDLARLAGLHPAGVICEIMNRDGTMARLPALRAFARRYRLRICTISDLIHYRRRNERLIKREEVVKLPTDYGEFDLYLYRSLVDGQHHLALVKGIVDGPDPVIVRVHSECLTGDVFGSRRCDCGNQLRDALRMIESAGNGVLVYMRQEGRGIGLPAKVRAYRLQEQGLDTVQANVKLGFPPDLREYGIGAQILNDLGVRKLRLLTNNPKKVVGLEGYGLEIVQQLPIRVPSNLHNRRYLETKKKKLGHWL